MYLERPMMASTTTKPVSVRLENQVLEDTTKYKINRSEVCNKALKKEIEKAKKKNVSKGN